MANIVYYDDDPTEIIDPLTKAESELVDSFSPNVVGDFARAFEKAKNADLWVFDYFLGVQDNTDATLGDENGLSAFEKWRRRLKEDRPPTALVSNALEKVLAPGIPAARSHIHARQAGVEWVGPKAQFSAVFALLEASKQIRVSLADFPSPSNDDGGVADLLCEHILDAPAQVPWRRSAERQVDRARPPSLSIAANACGRTRLIMAWLLHRILPYPSFLLTRDHAAVRMGIMPDTFDRLAVGSASNLLSDALRSAEYTGPLAKFSGPRWWRAGIDHLAWSKSQDPAGYEAALTAGAVPVEVKFLSISNPVIISNADLVETDEIRDASECVRAQDDDFPADVPPAWVLLDTAKRDGELAAQVIFEDQAQLAAAREDDNKPK